MMRVWWEEAKLLFFFAYYCAANYVPLALPAVAYYAAFRGSVGCRLFLFVAVMDFLYPLRPGPNGVWMAFMKLTSMIKGLESFFAAEIIVEGTYETNQNYCICYFPHSVFGVGIGLIGHYMQETYGTQLLFTVADIVFAVPILRRIMTWWGCTSASERTLVQNLKLAHPHNMLVLQPDGIAGMFHGLDCEQIVLDRRKGFCRVALQTGTALVPCYTFGANQLYNRWFGPRSMAAKLSSKLRMSLIVWSDRWGIPFGFVPNRTKMIVVLGPPIPVRQTNHPTKEQIDALHSQFVTAIKDLYDRHKSRMGKEWVETRGEKLYLESERIAATTPRIKKD